MRILYDYQAFTRQLYGGVSRYYVELARQLPQIEDTEVKILAPLYLNHHLKELDPGIVSGRQVTKLPKISGKLLNIYNRAATRHQSDNYAPDVLHETYFARRAISLRSNPVHIITVHDMIHERYPEHFPRWDMTSTNKQLAVARADHVICVSENTRRDLLELGNIRPEKVSVVHHGFDTPRIQDAPTQQLIDGPYLLYVGIRSGYKNFQRLLEAYAGNPALHNHFRLVCFGGGKLSRAEKQQRKKLGLHDDSLLWTGGSDRVLIQLYHHAAAFVYPSLYEGFGFPPLEAMAHSCPVICSTGGSIPEIVGDAGEYFDPRDSGAMTEAIEKVTGSQQRADELRELGRKRTTCYSWEQCARNTHAVYSSLL